MTWFRKMQRNIPKPACLLKKKKKQKTEVDNIWI